MQLQTQSVCNCIYLLYMFHVVTVIILFFKHWGSRSAFKFLNIWTYVH